MVAVDTFLCDGLPWKSAASVGDSMFCLLENYFTSASNDHTACVWKWSSIPQWKFRQVTCQTWPALNFIQLSTIWQEVALTAKSDCERCKPRKSYEQFSLLLVPFAAYNLPALKTSFSWQRIRQSGFLWPSPKFSPWNNPNMLVQRCFLGR